MIVLKDEATRKKFIELKAQGLSYRKIQREIGISRPTISAWSKKYAKRIETARKRFERKTQREKEKRMKKWSLEVGEILARWVEGGGKWM